MRWNYVIGPCALVLALTGCAGLGTGIGDGQSKGIRYYESRPFILVHTDSKGGLTSKLIWLPDTRKIRTLRPYAVAAKSDATFTFSNGVLSQANSTVDTTVIPTAIISALKSTAVAAAGAALNDTKAQDETQLPAPILYAINSQPDGTWSISASAATPPQVSLIFVTQPKEK